MTKTLIRYATTADFDSLLAIDVASFPGGVAYDADELAYFMNHEGAETIVADVNGTVVAFLIMELHRTRRTATIVTLDVHEGQRRQGHGSLLLKRSEKMLMDHGVEAYDLQVDVANRPAIAFYEKHGFKALRRIRNYYANGHDAFLMVKELA